jgi:hypothetical protein
MKISRHIKIVTVDGIYLPDGALGGVVKAPGVAFSREGLRRWDGRPIRRAAKRGRRAAELRLALSEARA